MGYAKARPNPKENAVQQYEWMMVERVRKMLLAGMSPGSEIIIVSGSAVGEQLTGMVHAYTTATFSSF